MTYVATAVAVHPNGQLAFSGSFDGTVRLWRLPGSQEDFITWVAAKRYIPELTCEQREKYGLAACVFGRQLPRRSYSTPVLLAYTVIKHNLRFNATT